MVKGCRRFAILIATGIIALLATTAVAQYNRNVQPIPLIKRLSYENFRNIKMLQTAIINYGGGETDVDRLIDQYAEASALYFQNKIEASADLYTKNQQEILKVAQKIAAKFNADTNKLLNESIRFNIKHSIRESLKGKKQNQPANKLLNRARFAVQRGNDFYDRFKLATTSSARGMVSAIYYYRRAKENMLQMHDILLTEDPKKKEEFLLKYKRDMEDNKNKVYQSKEKVN